MLPFFIHSRAVTRVHLVPCLVATTAFAYHRKFVLCLSFSLALGVISSRSSLFSVLLRQISVEFCLSEFSDREVYFYLRIALVKMNRLI